MPKSDTHFRGEGKGIPHGTKPISVKYPPEVDKILRSLKNRSEYIRTAVIAALKKDGLLQDVE